MKKLSRILILVLSIIAIVTAFTVVALAADGETTKPEPVYRRIFNVDTDDYVKDQTYNNNASKIGKWYIGQADNGNKYLVGAYDTATGTNADNIEQTLPGTTYGVKNYPTFALDFDFLTPTGQCHWSATIRLDLYAYVQKPDKSGYAASRVTQMIATRLDNSNSTGINIPKKANVWQHVTYVVQYVGDGVFDYHFYVDGVKTNTTSVDFKTTKLTHGSNDLIQSTNWTDFLEEFPSVNFEKLGIYTTILNPAYKSETEELWYDNMQAHYYTADYSIEEVASYVYNGNYEMPYGFTEAKIGDTVYDDANKAIKAAEEGQTVKLTKNADTTLVIDNAAIFVDTNVYDENGAATGSFYTCDFASTQGYVATETAEGSGIYETKKSSNTVNLIWDEACAETCDCYKEFGGHNLTSTTVGVLGETPEFFGNIPTFDIVNGLVKEFIGWSYTKDSATVDTLLPITADDVAAGTIKLYPVYKATQYDFSVAQGSQINYYMETEFATVLNNTSTAASGATITLHDDLTFTHSILLKSTGRTLSFDLNGYKLIREYSTIMKFNAVYNESLGKYVKDGDEIERINIGRDTTEITSYSNGTKVYTNGIFGLSKEANINITSSRPGAEVHAYYMSVEALVVDGEIVAYQNSYLNSGLPVFFLSPAPSSNFNIDAKNISFYTGPLFSAEHGSNNDQTTINIDGGNFYTVSENGMAEGVFGVRRGETVNVKNANFYCNGKMLSYTLYNKGTKYTFDNCNIYDFIIKAKYAVETYTFNDCNLVNASYDYNETVILGDGTAVSKNAAKYNIKPGYVYTNDTTKTYSYNTLNAGAVYDAASGKFVPNMTLSEEPVTGSFAYEVKKCSETPESITDARLSMLYYTNFNMLLYIPVVDGMAMEWHSADFEATGDTVKIDGNDYYVYKKVCSTTGASDTVKPAFKYSFGGKTYLQTFELSALVYADIILSTPWEEVETKAVANMVRYIKEARTAAGLTVDAKFDELLNKGNLADFGAKEDYADATVDYSGLSGVSLSFAISGTNAGYLIKLDEATFANAANATVTVKYADGTLIEGTGEYVAATDTTGAYYKYVTTKTKAYDIAEKAVEITVTIPEADGVEAVNLSGTYSVKAYINATNNTLAKAMYEFGVAAKAYRDFLLDL